MHPNSLHPIQNAGACRNFSFRKLAASLHIITNTSTNTHHQLENVQRANVAYNSSVDVFRRMSRLLFLNPTYDRKGNERYYGSWQYLCVVFVYVCVLHIQSLHTPTYNITLIFFRKKNFFALTQNVTLLLDKILAYAFVHDVEMLLYSAKHLFVTFFAHFLYGICKRDYLYLNLLIGLVLAPHVHTYIYIIGWVLSVYYI